MIREEREREELRRKETEERMAAMDEKFGRDVEELKRKHRSRMELMEQKFATENGLLNDEFLFLSQEIERLQGLSGLKVAVQPEIGQRAGTEKENQQMNRMRRELEEKGEKIEREIEAVVD